LFDFVFFHEETQPMKWKNKVQANRQTTAHFDKQKKNKENFVGQQK